ncbi:MAG: chemotaxis-specific protein-glutamate methyltransferase CheB [Kofleriaceae bacterium]
MTRPRVLVVDDSAFARTVISRLLRSSGDIDVVGTAIDGRDALDQIARLDPDVVTLDLTMPELDGIGVLRALRARPRPRVIVVSVSSVETELGVEALTLGAFDIVAKPTALATDRLKEIGRELISKVLLAIPAVVPVHAAALTPGRLAHRATLVMIGTSTGGPQALTKLMAGLPAKLAAPVAMVLHIPVGYTEALARRLDKISPLDVVEGQDGMELRPGLAVLAPGGMHMHIERSGETFRARLATLPLSAFRPSVNELFTSGAAAAGSGALGVVLTGMGDDGLEGARAVSRGGGSLLTESAATCVVYGMPRCVFEANLGARAVSLDEMAVEIAKHV